MRLTDLALAPEDPLKLSKEWMVSISIFLQHSGQRTTNLAY